jgi:endonuclease YncB( thermonuclease family)
MKKHLAFLALIATLLPITATATAPTPAKIVRLNDGDTAVVDNGLIADVRIACIDAPEVPHSRRETETGDAIAQTQFKWGRLAQARISNLLANTSSTIVVTPVDTDRYGRNIASVRFGDGSDWATRLVSEGLAFVYRDYMKIGCDKDVLLEAEAEAKRQKLGIWSEEVMLPSEFRKR